MSASIRIESGIAAGTNYWIDRPVLRIGSDPQCEICVPSADLAPHALTLEFRGGMYRAYNRGSSPISIGSTTLQPGTAAAWEEDEAAMLPGGLRLVLSFDGDPRPSPRQESRIDDGFDNEGAAVIADGQTVATPAAAKTSKTKTLIQMAVTGFCIAAMAGFLMLGRGGTEAPVQNQPSFDAIVVASLNQDDKIRTLVQKLQFAQSFLVRGRIDIAKLCFADLRDQLIHQTDSLPPADRQYAAVIRNYVELRLSQLQ